MGGGGCPSCRRSGRAEGCTRRLRRRERHRDRGGLSVWSKHAASRVSPHHSDQLKTLRPRCLPVTQGGTGTDRQLSPRRLCPCPVWCLLPVRSGFPGTLWDGGQRETQTPKSGSTCSLSFSLWFSEAAIVDRLMDVSELLKRGLLVCFSQKKKWRGRDIPRVGNREKGVSPRRREIRAHPALTVPREGAAPPAGRTGVGAPSLRVQPSESRGGCIFRK